MSTFKVPLTTINSINPHPNADRLELATVYGFSVVVQKDRYKVGDLIVYVPIDSILPEELEKNLFPPDSKIKLNKSRIKQIKIRGAYSQGMLIDPLDLSDMYDRGDTTVKFHCTVDFNGNTLVNEKLEDDFSDRLRITKYESTTPNYQNNMGAIKKKEKKLENPYFHKYGGIDNFKWYPNLFKEGELVSVTEKIHGSNFRAGYVPFSANTLWKKIKRFFSSAPEYEFVYGSNNVQLQERPKYTGFYETNIYEKMVEKYDLKNKLAYGEVLYGELYGDGIQKNYNYGCKSGEYKLVVFDIKYQTKNTSDYYTPDQLKHRCSHLGLEVVPELYNGLFNQDLVKSLTLGNSVLCPEQKVREGVVIKPLQDEACYMGRKVLKVISEKYLESDQTNFH